MAGSATPERWFCGDQIILGDQLRTVLACVDRPDHDTHAAHRSGTDPEVRWRADSTDSSVVNVWLVAGDFHG